ncbi:MAG: phage tail tape measure protein [Candidatus Saccharibacteria bacterium]|nr:phage tail tape measure protein [Candidatus Saccharibacteria bacterium]
MIKFDKLFRRFRMATLLLACLLNAGLSPLAHAVAPSATASADDLERRYRETNDVLYYDHSCSSSGSSSDASVGNGDAGGCGNKGGNDKANEQQIWDYLTGQLVKKGFSKDDAANAAAGIMGNWRQESNLNSYVAGGSGCGSSAAFGIAQWCGDRITKAKAFIAAQGKPADCLGAQLEYAWQELDQSYGPMLNKMKGQPASQDALIFDHDYEVSTDQANGNNNREKNATDIYNEIVNGQSLPAGVGGSISPTSSTSSATSSAASSGSSCDSVAADNGECKNPFRDLKNSSVSRIDGGYDYGGTGGSGPIYAACPAQIVLVDASGSGWPGSPGAYVKYKITSGKAKDLFMYIAEDCTPTVKVGDTVDTNKSICDYQDHGTELETGWASGGGGTGYVEWSDYNKSICGGSFPSNSGVDVDKFLQTLGLKHDSLHSECGSSHTPPPANWPKWGGDSAVNA